MVTFNNLLNQMQTCCRKGYSPACCRRCKGRGSAGTCGKIMIGAGGKSVKDNQPYGPLAQNGPVYANPSGLVRGIKPKSA
ncbi:hypothetical protein BKA67DRAFT_553213 [Truncatella angustata]|uniref:Uncharacterized protein n=1 Tax=Truncatella angustata TaxID=152316 RepID=A0A9P8UR29_9PEZI|nr:uncharacterized protein BKA67DRAFT_553213 [Truncatella angustata]KAH6656803.1 hypothetical protein BKA67DRAFT_553213 [Truncatella angustata]